MKKIGIVGFGYVGKVIDEFFRSKHEVYHYDPNSPTSSTKDKINECDIAYVCVPTQPNEDGSCNTSLVEEAINWLQTPIIVIKSTVEPGTTKKLNEKTGKKIVFSPEFAGESSYWNPYKCLDSLKEIPFFIFGGEKEVCRKLIELYQPIAGPAKTYRITDSTSAELVKYVENSFFSTKIAFCNEIFDLAKTIGCDWNEVRELWILDPRINSMHTLVFTENRGFGGKCFPKDTEALLSFSKKVDSKLSILETVIESNKRIRKERN
jgi:nucleotide sugar dehydrogenase